LNLQGLSELFHLLLLGRLSIQAPLALAICQNAPAHPDGRVLRVVAPQQLNLNLGRFLSLADVFLDLI